jgi:phosphatidylglycerophosphate synthase
MSAVLQFNPSWYVLLLAFFLSWLVLVLIRRGHGGKKEAKEQACLVVAGSVTLVSMEIFAISTNLWNYVPGNWPIILWPTYLAAILFGYQLLRFIEEIF